MFLSLNMSCNYNKNLPHIQILSHPNSKIGQFFSSKPTTIHYTKSKKGLTSLKSQAFLLVIDYSVFNELQVHVIVRFAVIC